MIDPVHTFTEVERKGQVITIKSGCGIKATFKVQPDDRIINHSFTAWHCRTTCEDCLARVTKGDPNDIPPSTPSPGDRRQRVVLRRSRHHNGSDVPSIHPC